MRRSTSAGKIPVHEEDLLAFTLEEAEEHVEAGRVEDGYECMAGGLYRAQELDPEQAPWAPQLVERWEDAVAEFCRLHNVVRD